MNLKDLSTPLRIDQIDFRVQSINKGGYATILAYKDARCDMQRLDEVCGPLGWKREHSRDNHNCTVSIWDDETCQWVGKEDTGTESNAEAEKGLASDSFKRACFNWGIGRELYDYPVIQVKLDEEEYEGTKPTWKLRLKEWEWSSIWVEGKLRSLTATHNNRIRFNYTGGLAVIEPAYTPDQLATFRMLLDSGYGIGFLEFSKLIGDEAATALYNSGEPKKKVALKKMCAMLEAKGHEELDQAAVDIQEQLDQEDPHALHMATEIFDVGPFVKKALWGRLSKESQDKLIKMKESV